MWSGLEKKKEKKKEDKEIPRLPLEGQQGGSPATGPRSSTKWQTAEQQRVTLRRRQPSCRGEHPNPNPKQARAGGSGEQSDSLRYLQIPHRLPPPLPSLPLMAATKNPPTPTWPSLPPAPPFPAPPPVRSQSRSKGRRRRSAAVGVGAHRCWARRPRRGRLWGWAAGTRTSPRRCRCRSEVRRPRSSPPRSGPSWSSRRSSTSTSWPASPSRPISSSPSAPAPTPPPPLSPSPAPPPRPSTTTTTTRPVSSPTIPSRCCLLHSRVYIHLINLCSNGFVLACLLVLSYHRGRKLMDALFRREERIA